MKQAIRVSSQFAALAMLTVAVSAQQGASPADRWTQFRGSAALLGTTQATLPAQLQVLWTYEAGDAIDSSLTRRSPERTSR